MLAAGMVRRSRASSSVGLLKSVPKTVDVKMEFPPVSDLIQIVNLLNVVVMPMIGGGCLLLSKLAQGDAVRRAERRFLAALVMITIVTLRTVIVSGDVWLFHTLTLSAMIVGALLIPNQQDASPQRHDTSVAV